MSQSVCVSRCTQVAKRLWSAPAFPLAAARGAMAGEVRSGGLPQTRAVAVRRGPSPRNRVQKPPTSAAAAAAGAAARSTEPPLKRRFAPTCYPIVPGLRFSGRVPPLCAPRHPDAFYLRKSQGRVCPEHETSRADTPSRHPRQEAVQRGTAATGSRRYRRPTKHAPPSLRSFGAGVPDKDH